LTKTAQCLQFDIVSVCVTAVLNKCMYINRETNDIPY